MSFHDQAFLEYKETAFDPGAQVEARQDFRHIAGQVVVATILGLHWRRVEGDEHEDPGSDVAFGSPMEWGYEEDGWRQMMVFRAGIFTSILMTTTGELSGVKPTLGSAAESEEFGELGVHQIDRRSQEELVSVLHSLVPVLREVMRILASGNGEISKAEVSKLLESTARNHSQVQGSVQS
ncbi:MAG: hypothetical protein Q8K32_07250 [Archangium sp.]|nr:hypothetical protein [Archangium sp.]